MLEAKPGRRKLNSVPGRCGKFAGTNYHRGPTIGVRFIYRSQLGRSSNRVHPQPPNPQARTSEASGVMPEPPRSRLRTFRPTPKPSHPSSTTSQRQVSQHRARRFPGRPRRYCFRGRSFDPGGCRSRPSRFKASDLALRSFRLASGGGAVAGEGQTVGRGAETSARGAGRRADRAGDVGIGELGCCGWTCRRWRRRRPCVISECADRL